MLMGTFSAASKPFPFLSLSFPSISASSLAVCFVLTWLYLLSFLCAQSLWCCLAKVPFTSQSLFTSSFLPSAALFFSLSSLMNGVAGL